MPLASEAEDLCEAVVDPVVELKARHRANSMMVVQMLISDQINDPWILSLI